MKVLKILAILMGLLCTGCAGMAKAIQDHERNYPSAYRYHVWSSHLDKALAEEFCASKAPEGVSLRIKVGITMDCMQELGWYR